MAKYICDICGDTLWYKDEVVFFMGDTEVCQMHDEQEIDWDREVCVTCYQDEQNKEQLNDALFDLLDIYNRIVPNDEAFLCEYPDLSEEIDTINTYPLNNTTDEIKKECKHIIAFIYEWFPDSWDEEDRESLKEKITALEKNIQKD